MQVLIENRKNFRGPGVSPIWAAIMESIAGTWIEVDTKYLFKTSFNGIVNTDLGICDIPLRYVSEIKDDMRRYRKRCSWCGNHCALVEKKCPTCKKDDYFQRFFPQKKKLKHSLGTITFTESNPTNSIKGIS